MELKLDDGSFINFDQPTLRVQVFKKSGKWYTSGSYILTEDDRWLYDRPWDFATMVKSNDPFIGKFSPVTNGFSKEFVFVFECFLPSGVRGFMNMLVDPSAEV